MPLLLISLVLVALFFNRKPKIAKGLLIATTLMLFILSFMPSASFFIQGYESKYPSYKPVHGSIDFIVILGCGHTSDINLAASQELKICSLQRLIEGVRIANLHPNATLITSGAAITDISSNALKVKQAAMELGIAEQRIIVEPRPLDTEDEAMYISEVVKNSSFILITNANHMPRSMNYFIQAGTNPIPAPTGFHVKDNNGDKRWQDYFPRSINLTISETAWYETLGLWWQALKR